MNEMKNKIKLQPNHNANFNHLSDAQHKQLQSQPVKQLSSTHGFFNLSNNNSKIMMKPPGAYLSLQSQDKNKATKESNEKQSTQNPHKQQHSMTLCFPAPVAVSIKDSSLIKNTKKNNTKIHKTKKTIQKNIPSYQTSSQLVPRYTSSSLSFSKDYDDKLVFNKLNNVGIGVVLNNNDNENDHLHVHGNGHELKKQIYKQQIQEQQQQKKNVDIYDNNMDMNLMMNSIESQNDVVVKRKRKYKCNPNNNNIQLDTKRISLAKLQSTNRHQKQHHQHQQQRMFVNANKLTPTTTDGNRFIQRLNILRNNRDRDTYHHFYQKQKQKSKNNPSINTIFHLPPSSMLNNKNVKSIQSPSSQCQYPLLSSIQSFTDQKLQYPYLQEQNQQKQQKQKMFEIAYEQIITKNQQNLLLNKLNNARQQQYRQKTKSLDCCMMKKPHQQAHQKKKFINNKDNNINNKLLLSDEEKQRHKSQNQKSKPQRRSHQPRSLPTPFVINADSEQAFLLQQMYRTVYDKIMNANGNANANNCNSSLIRHSQRKHRQQGIQCSPMQGMMKIASIKQAKEHPGPHIYRKRKEIFKSLSEIKMMAAVGREKRDERDEKEEEGIAQGDHNHDCNKDVESNDHPTAQSNQTPNSKSKKAVFVRSISTNRNGNPNSRNTNNNSLLQTIYASTTTNQRKPIDIDQDTVYQKKITSFFSFILKVRAINGFGLRNDFCLANKYSNLKKYQVFIGKGNNRLLIVSLLKRRFWLEIVGKITPQTNFIWTQKSMKNIHQAQRSCSSDGQSSRHNQTLIKLSSSVLGPQSASLSASVPASASITNKQASTTSSSHSSTVLALESNKKVDYMKSLDLKSYHNEISKSNNNDDDDKQQKTHIIRRSLIMKLNTIEDNTNSNINLNIKQKKNSKIKFKATNNNKMSLKSKEKHFNELKQMMNKKLFMNDKKAKQAQFFIQYNMKKVLYSGGTSRKNQQRKAQCRNQATEEKSYQIKKDVLTNHLPNNTFIGSKKTLFHSMQLYHRIMTNIDPFSILPQTYCINTFDEEQRLTDLNSFLSVEESTNQSKDKIWIVKPGQHSNRGNGISLMRHSSIDCNFFRRQELLKGGALPKSVILQKYITNPLLYYNRKFDIRSFMMLTSVNGKIKAFWYQEGYLRTCSEYFTLNDLDNNFIHLTNDAIQKEGPNYGKYQPGNKLSYSDFQRYLDTDYAAKYQKRTDKRIDFKAVVLERMKQITLDVIKANYLNLDSLRKQNNFEIFGIDFMVDRKLNVWLIEMNSNPCLEVNCPLMSHIIPIMLENSLRLGLDPIFFPNTHFPPNKRCFLPDNILQNLKYQILFDQDCLQHEEKLKLQKFNHTFHQIFMQGQSKNNLQRTSNKYMQKQQEIINQEQQQQQYQNQGKQIELLEQM